MAASEAQHMLSWLSTRARLVVSLACAASTVAGCGHRAPRWLLIEYPDPSHRSVMSFPGVRADSFDECARQAAIVRGRRTEAAANYAGQLLCGSNCRFSADWGSPLCDETIEIPPTRDARAALNSPRPAAEAPGARR